MNQSNPKQPSGRYQFGIFEADIGSGELRRSGVRVRIQSQPFKVLAALLEQPGAIVTREELQHRLWTEGTTVDFDHGLGIAVNKLREALGDSAENPRFVETLARRGYRFLAPVNPGVLPASVAAPIAQPAEAPSSGFAANGSATQADPIDSPNRPNADHPNSARSGSAKPMRLRAIWIVAAVFCTATILMLLAPWIRPTSRESYTIAQVTFSNRVMNNEIEVRSVSTPVTDGSRIYFINMENGVPELTEALIANGELRRLPLPEALSYPIILSISPDGSSLLVRNHQLPKAEEPIWVVESLTGNARRIPGVLGHDAIWMPDGKHLLVATANCLQELAGDGSGAQTVVTLSGPAFWPRWSPDGTKLRLTVWNGESRTTELWELDSHFGRAHPLLPDWSSPSSECCGSWTADGQNYVFQSMHSGHTDLWKIREKPWYARDWQPSQITGGPLDYEAPVGAVPSNAKEARRIFFIGDNPQIEILEADPAGPGFIAQPLGLKAAALTEYSADGKRVAWLNAADGSLWCSRIDGSDRIELISPPTRIFHMRWSPDGRQLAVAASPPGAPWKIYLIDSEGGQPRMLLAEDRNEADPTWSPDGKTIVFGRLPDRMDSARLTKAIYEVDVPTRKVAAIPGSEGLFSPRLSPDGRYIAAVRLDQRALLLFDRTTQRWTTLSNLGTADPVWSHDGKYLFFQDFLTAGKPIYKVALPSGKIELVSTIDSLRTIPVIDYRLIALAPGDRPVISARTSNVNLYSIQLD